MQNKDRENERKIKNLITQNEQLKNKQERENREMTNKNAQLQRDLENLENKYNNLQINSQYQISNINEKNNRLERDIQSLESQNKAIRTQYDDLKTESNKNKSKLENLTIQHDNLKKKQEEEEIKKKEKKKNFENFRNTFRKDKEVIESQNIKESKIYIKSFIINEFIKEYEKSETNKKSIGDFTNSLLSYMSKFSEEYISYCNNFIQSFKSHSQKIIKDYKVNQNQLSIEHINFIVIGRAGIGKSCFINECLKLEPNKKAKEGKGVSVTEKSILYLSEKLKMIRMWDTQGLDYKINQSYILNEIKRL